MQQIIVFSDPFPETVRFRSSTRSSPHQDLTVGHFGPGTRNTNIFTNPSALLPSLAGAIFENGTILRTDNLLSVIGSGLFSDVELFASFNDELVTAREVGEVLQLQSFDTIQFTETRVRQFQSLETPLEFINGDNGQLLVLFGDENTPLSFVVFDSDFNVVAPSVLQSPVIQSAAIASSTSISLEWDRVNGAAGYLVEKRESGEEEFTTIGETDFDQLTFVDSASAGQPIIEYRITATNGTVQSQPSLVAEVVFESPGAVENFSFSQISSTSAQVSWDQTPNSSSYLFEFRRAGSSFLYIQHNW